VQARLGGPHLRHSGSSAGAAARRVALVSAERVHLSQPAPGGRTGLVGIHHSERRTHGQVPPPPRPNCFHDGNSGLAEIYLRFAIPILVLTTLSRYHAFADTGCYNPASVMHVDGFQLPHLVGDSALGPFTATAIAAPPTHFNPHAYHFKDGSSTGLYVLYTNGGGFRTQAAAEADYPAATTPPGIWCDVISTGVGGDNGIAKV
jgi:hypothetical protein